MYKNDIKTCIYWKIWVNVIFIQYVVSTMFARYSFYFSILKQINNFVCLG